MNQMLSENIEEDLEKEEADAENMMKLMEEIKNARETN